MHALLLVKKAQVKYVIHYNKHLTTVLSTIKRKSLQYKYNWEIIQLCLSASFHIKLTNNNIKLKRTGRNI